MDLPLLFEAGVIIAYMIIMFTKLAYLIITIILAYVINWYIISPTWSSLSLFSLVMVAYIIFAHMIIISCRWWSLTCTRSSLSPVRKIFRFWDYSCLPLYLFFLNHFENQTSIAPTYIFTTSETVSYMYFCLNRFLLFHLYIVFFSPATKANGATPPIWERLQADDWRPDEYG